jgi:hypothetical protein
VFLLPSLLEPNISTETTTKREKERQGGGGDTLSMTYLTYLAVYHKGRSFNTLPLSLTTRWGTVKRIFRLNEGDKQVVT